MSNLEAISTNSLKSHHSPSQLQSKTNRFKGSQAGRCGAGASRTGILMSLGDELICNQKPCEIFDYSSELTTTLPSIGKTQI